MIDLKSRDEIALMQEGGNKLGQILKKLLVKAQPGVTLLAIEKLAGDLITHAGGTPSFKTVKGYRWATCLCVNDVVVHGTPTDYVLSEGDILTIDVGMLYQGLHTDTAWTKIVHSTQYTDSSELPQHQKAPDFSRGMNGLLGLSVRSFASDTRKKPRARGSGGSQKFLKVGEEALRKAVDQARVNNRIGHISLAIQSTIEGAGYSIVKTLVGHGVGRELHEAPQIPGFLKGRLEDTMPLEEGMTLAIEVIYAQGSGAVAYKNDDGWTIATKDSSNAAVFEHTVAITTTGPLILTGGPYLM